MHSMYKEKTICFLLIYAVLVRVATVTPRLDNKIKVLCVKNVSLCDVQSHELFYEYLLLQKIFTIYEGNEPYEMYKIIKQSEA